MPAFGAIIYQNNRITPYVFVSRVDSLVKETACGSGSVAFSLFSGKNKIIQPTGKAIFVRKNSQKSKSLNIWLYWYNHR
ncbi:hypothetical protein HY837_01990 [archaeon]|nr:hypothetical protein [archaeon]